MPEGVSRHLVVTYHYVRPENSDGVTGVSPREFEAQIRAIKARHRAVTVEEFVSEVGGWEGAGATGRGGVEGEGRERIALVTFDDAVRDQYRFAAPILEKHGVPAVFFAPMRPYSDEPNRWCAQHLLHALAQELGWEELERRVGPRVSDVVVDVAAMDRLYHYEAARKRRMKWTLAFGVEAARATEILRSINEGIGLRAEDWFMTAEQLRELQSAGHALGGHGFDHVAYSTLTPTGMAADMHRAQEWATRLFGAMGRAIAYPFGRADGAAEAIARGCGHTYGFTTENRVDAKFVGARLGMD